MKLFIIKQIKNIIKKSYNNLINIINNAYWHVQAVKFRANWLKYRNKYSFHAIHIGCGSFLLDGWLNCDIKLRNNKNEGTALWDFRYAIPVNSSSVDAIFNEHFLEHLSYNDALFFIEECFRVLKTNGILRISTPDLQKIISLYNDKNPFVDLSTAINRHKRIMGYKNDISKAYFFNDKMRAWGHLFIYDYETLSTILKEKGFRGIKIFSYGESSSDKLKNLEHHANEDWMKFAEPLIVEAIK